MGKGLFGKLFENIGGFFDTKADNKIRRGKIGKSGAKPHGFFPDPDDPDFEEKMMLIHMLRASGAFEDDEDFYVTEGIYLDDEDSILDELTISTVETEMKPFVDTFIGSNLVNADDVKLLSKAGYKSADLELMSPRELKKAMETAGVDTDFYNFDE